LDCWLPGRRPRVPCCYLVDARRGGAEGVPDVMSKASKAGVLLRAYVGTTMAHEPYRFVVLERHVVTDVHYQRRSEEVGPVLESC